MTQNLLDTAKAVLREFYSNTTSLQAPRKITNNLNLHLKQLDKQEQTKRRFCIRKQITKIRAEINEIEMKKLWQRSVKVKGGYFRQKKKKKNL